VMEILAGGTGEARLAEVTHALGGALLALHGIAPDAEAGAATIAEAIASGRAAERFEAMVAALGGPADIVARRARPAGAPRWCATWCRRGAASSPPSTGVRWAGGGRAGRRPAGGNRPDRSRGRPRPAGADRRRRRQPAPAGPGACRRYLDRRRGGGGGARRLYGGRRAGRGTAGDPRPGGMSRAFLIVMDSVGCGGAPDAAAFGDAGANTLAHIAEACAAGRAEDGRSGPLRMPVLDRLGLGAAIRLASGAAAPGLGAPPQGRWGAATEISPGKDTPSGHWELAGQPVPWDWHYFPDTRPGLSTRTEREVRPAGRHRRHPRRRARLGHRDHRAAGGRSICAPAGRSAIPRAIRSSRSPRMKKALASNGFWISARRWRPGCTRCGSAG
jgi:hypothetical protein